ncbi:MAG TPA: FlgD immunoglobulin-like domain containing protein [Candidatus Eisenbacteria bacterium]|nr:FlgD immunoglobulin-like domain containing protein [Candidatus Eisenbacteria bacterium]
MDHRFATAALCCLVALSPTIADAASTTLRWTAPGDDGATGRATAYDLRRSTSPITAANFGAATIVTGLPAPATAGTTETFTVNGLAPNTSYYFAMKTRDDANNWSTISNIAFLPGGTVGVEDAPVALEFSAPMPNPARFSVTWAYALPEPAPMIVEVFDLDGRRVRTVADGMRPAGQGQVRWDLRDASARPVSAGIYMVRARMGGQVWTRRVAVVR